MNKKPQRVRIVNTTGVGVETKVTLEDGTPIDNVTKVEITHITPGDVIEVKLTIVGIALDILGEIDENNPQPK